jgi:hypothetical protein
MPRKPHSGLKMADGKKKFGWVPPKFRNPVEEEAHEVAMSRALPSLKFTNGVYREADGRFACWKPFSELMVQEGVTQDPQLLPYNFQTTGSCVGAGGENMLKTLMAVEIRAGELEAWKRLWWPYPYGKSRLRAGMRTPGEGSLGSTWADAITKDGIFAWEAKPGLPPFKNVSGWQQLTAADERQWSDGDAASSVEVAGLGLEHLVGSYAIVRNSDEWKAAHQNGYCVTLASMFGTRGPTRKGNPEIMVADWNDTWPHQMYSDETWDHPSLGRVHRIGNNWGKTAHPAPLQGEPWGGLGYIMPAIADKICREREVIAFSFFSGFKQRRLDWLT